jgi:uncharacterized membrane protein
MDKCKSAQDNSLAIGNSILDRIARWCARHWLALLNTLVLLYGGLPWLAPLLQARGYTMAGNLIFLLYTPLCHQKPAQSFFLLGHQVAFCHREAAMYTLLFLGGLLYASLRKKVRPISLRATGYLLLPMLLDGGTHLIDDLLHWVELRGSDAPGSLNWWLRMLTGLLFAIAVILGLYTRLDRSFRPEIDNSQKPASR